MAFKGILAYYILSNHVFTSTVVRWADQKRAKQLHTVASRSARECLGGYIQAAGIADHGDDRPRRAARRIADELSRLPMETADVWRMIRRRIHSPLQ